jgi:mannose-6-phosphate isomerase-like protein (cupin superfamily)
MPNDDAITRPEEHLKGWGKEIWIVNIPLYCGKILEVNKGKKCSIHYHKTKHETLYILKGKVQMDIYNKGYPGTPTTMVMLPEDTITIQRRLPHQFIGLEDSQILEVSTHHSEKDSYRYVKGD